ncbi:MAG: hypothetical protein RIA65_16615, partial [Woeseia sp.]
MTQLVHFARIALLLFLSSWLAACGGAEESATTTPGADAVYKNGRIYTVDGQRSWAEALAISDGKIVYVGSNDGVAAHTGSNTAVTE